MNDKLLLHWLSAEIRGRDAEAERILFEVMSSLPLAVPSAGFTDRVLVGAGVVWSRRARVATAVSLAMAGLAAAFLLPLAIALAQLITPGDVLAAAAQGLARAAGALAELFSLWLLVAHLRETLWLVVATPPVALTLLAMTAVATLAGRWLAQMLSFEQTLSLRQMLSPQRSS